FQRHVGVFDQRCVRLGLFQKLAPAVACLHENKREVLFSLQFFLFVCHDLASPVLLGCVPPKFVTDSRPFRLRNFLSRCRSIVSTLRCARSLKSSYSENFSALVICFRLFVMNHLTRKFRHTTNRYDCFCAAMPELVQRSLSQLFEVFDTDCSSRHRRST